MNVTASLERHYSRSAILVAGVGVFATDLDLLIEELICTDQDSSGQCTDHRSSTPSPTAIEPGVSTFAY